MTACHPVKAQNSRHNSPSTCGRQSLFLSPTLHARQALRWVSKRNTSRYVVWYSIQDYRYLQRAKWCGSSLRLRGPPPSQALVPLLIETSNCLTKPFITLFQRRRHKADPLQHRYSTLKISGIASQYGCQSASELPLARGAGEGRERSRCW